MSTKSGHDLDHATGDHHHGGKHHHGDHHGKHHHKDHHGHKHPSLRDATIKAGRARGESVTSHGGGGGTGHSPPHGRPRAGTLTRRDTAHGLQKHRHDHDRMSVGKQSEGHAPIVELENTYKLEPDTRFQETKVREIITNVLKENLPDKEYEPRTMSRRCMELSDVIKEKVKQLDMKRFKIVCMVFIGQMTDQSMMITSRCLWNFNYDNFSSSSVKKGAYYAVGMVFATYTE